MLTLLGPDLARGGRSPLLRHLLRAHRGHHPVVTLQFPSVSAATASGSSQPQTQLCPPKPRSSGRGGTRGRPPMAAPDRLSCLLAPLEQTFSLVAPCLLTEVKSAGGKRHVMLPVPAYDRCSPVSVRRIWNAGVPRPRSSIRGHCLALGFSASLPTGPGSSKAAPEAPFCGRSIN